MVDRLKRLRKNLNQDRQETDFNTRRVGLNLPMVERKLDIVAPTHTYSLEFPLTGPPHSVFLNFRVKPDNCCDCEFGAATLTRDAFATPNTFSYLGDSLVAIYTTGVIYDSSTNPYHDSNPWWHSLYEDFSDQIGYYTISPEGYIVIPTDGIYTIVSRGVINGTAVDSTAYVINSLRSLSIGDSEWNVLASRKYSINIGNLDLTNGSTYITVCTPLHEGDKVSVFYTPYNVPDLTIPSSETVVSLRGLGWGSLAGYVRDINGDPVPGATVSYTLGFGGSTLTDVNGHYYFEQLIPATYAVTATKTGFSTMTRDIQVTFEDTAFIDFLI